MHVTSFSTGRNLMRFSPMKLNVYAIFVGILFAIHDITLTSSKIISWHWLIFQIVLIIQNSCIGTANQRAPL